MSVPAALAGRALATPALARAPIWFLRHGFGAWGGERLLLLEHVGRRSGQVRYVCLEVVARPAADRVVVVSGFGERAQWFRNLRATPSCHITLGRRRRVAAVAHVLSPDRRDQVLKHYAQERPRSWGQLCQVIEQATGAPASDVPAVELRLSID